MLRLDRQAIPEQHRAFERTFGIPVIEAMGHFYAAGYSNIHRGVHWLSQHATELYDGARATVQRLLNAARADEITWEDKPDAPFRGIGSLGMKTETTPRDEA